MKWRYFYFQRMLSFSSSNRITASDALLHPYFSDDGFAPLSFSPSTSASASTSTRSMRTSDGSDRMTDRSFDSSLTFSSHDESGGSFADMSGSSKWKKDSLKKFVLEKTFKRCSDFQTPFIFFSVLSLTKIPTEGIVKNCLYFSI